MGIAGLLPQLKSITRRAHVSMYRGQTVAVDAYCLLHRGAYTCARELVEGEPTDRHVQYCMARMDLLTSAGVRPLVVFDGGRLPNKNEEERARQRNRDENRTRARALWQQGNKAAAYECYQRAVDVTPAHAKQFVEALKRKNVPFIVAPYEADAQMAYLALNGLVDVVLTEDSDLLCYGCPTVFFKMDKAGEGEEVRLADLAQAKELAFQGFGHDLFQEMCVLAGCDFVDSLPGIGIKKAHQHLRRTRCFLKVVRSLRFDGCKIPEGYEQKVQRALWTFKHQRVYCPKRRAAVHLHEVPGDDLAGGARVPSAAQLVDGEADFLGPALPDDVAQAIAEGDLDPITKQPFAEDLQPCTAPLAADAEASGFSRAAGGGGLGKSELAARPSTQLHRNGQQQKSGRGKSGQQKQQPGAGNGGNTLANYKGFLLGLPKPAAAAAAAAAADFKPPRPGGSNPGSQDSQQEQQPAGRGQQAEQEVSSPRQSPARAASRPAAAGGDTLASPTEAQWENFRRRLKSSGRALPAAAAAAPPTAATPKAAAGLSSKPAALGTSSYFVQPAALGMRRPSATQRSGGLLAQLKAALQPEPSIDDLLSNQRASSSSAEEAAAARLGSDSEDGDDGLEGVVPQQQLESGSRRRFMVPHRRQQHQPPKTPLDQLRLASSPSVDDLLEGSAAATASEEQAGGLLAASERSPLQQALPSQRLWMPQRVAAAPQQEQQLDLVSPAGPAALQQLQQEQDGAGITPGFYGASGSEAGSDVRRLTSARRPAAATPGSSSPQPLRESQRRQQQQRPSFDADELADGEPSPAMHSGDPIASLDHIPAAEAEAEAAVERAAQAALAAASQKMLRPLPPPPCHLQPGGSRPQASPVEDAAGFSLRAAAAAKRPLQQLAGQSENRRAENQPLGLLAGSSKRAKGVPPAGANPFAGFAFRTSD